MINLNVKRQKNRVGLPLRPIRNYRLLVLFLLAVVSVFAPLMPTHAATENDARIVYGDGTAVTPKSRAWQGNARNLVAETSLPTAGATVKATIIEAAPTRDEMVAGVINSSNLLTVYRWNGSTWASQWTVTLPSTHTPSFDIAYEQVSGKAMVVYSANVATTNELAYRTFNGTSWTGATTLNPLRTSGTVHAVVATSRPVTNEIAIGWGDSNLDLSVNYWNGTSWLGEPNSTLEADLARIDLLDSKIQSAIFDLEFEQQGGELLIIWAKEGEDGVRRVSRTVGANAGWGNTNWLDINTHKVRSISLVAHPNSDYIAIATEGEVTINSVVSWRIIMGMWDGASWQINSTASSMDVSTYGQQRHDIGWYENNGQVRAMLMYDVIGTDDLATRVYNKNAGTFSSSSIRTGTSDGYVQIKLLSNPHDRSRVIALTLGTDNALKGDELSFDDTYSSWLSISPAEGTIDTAVTAQSTLAGWATSFAYELFIPTAAPSAPTTPDATLFYDTSTNNNPIHRALTLATNVWGSAGQIPTSAAKKEFIDMKASPVRNEKIAAFVDTDGDMEVFRWDGVNWRREWFYPLGVSSTPRVAIAYEQLSGRAMVIYSRNTGTNDELGYRIWSGSSWSTESTYSAVRTNGVVGYIVAKPRPATDEIAVAWGDNNMDLSANYWANGAWSGERSTALETTLGGISASPTTIESPIFDLAFEGTSGELLIAWGHNAYITTDPLANNTLRRVTRTAGPSGAWSGITQSVLNNHVRDIRLASDPGSDYISAIFHSTGRADGTNDADFARLGYWSGSAWSFHGTGMGTSDMIAGESDVTTVWLASGGTSVALYILDRPAASTTGVHYTWYNKTANTWIFDTAGGLYRNSGSPLATQGKRQMKLIKDPSDASKATVILVDDNNDLFVKRISFDGTTVSFTSIEDGGVAMTDSISSSSALGWKSDFVYQNNTPAPSMLGVDIVNASGVSIAEPSVTMTSAVTGTSCQTVTGTFGTNGQRIRVQNTTAAPSWTLSIAPTSGSTSSWSSGTATYDFNDPAGTPQGCADGPDADSLVGGLTVNGFAATVTAQAGCTKLGIYQATPDFFEDGVVNSITLMGSGTNSPTNCYWDMQGIAITQSIPVMQAAGKYSINMTLTTVAN